MCFHGVNLMKIKYIVRNHSDTMYCHFNDMEFHFKRLSPKFHSLFDLSVVYNRYNFYFCHEMSDISFNRSINVQNLWKSCVRYLESQILNINGTFKWDVMKWMTKVKVAGHREVFQFYISL
jgi:hypothetical protein